MAKNVLGEKLVTCSSNPLTGFFRNGKCDTCADDEGMHTVCAIMTDAFLVYSKNKGNDLSTPRPEWSFAGIKPGDKWCLCAERFKEAYENNAAPKVLLEATNEKTLDLIEMDVLVSHAFYADKV